MTIAIHDGMTADEVWSIITDILQSVNLAAGDEAYDEVRDYVINHYEEAST